MLCLDSYIENSISIGCYRVWACPGLPLETWACPFNYFKGRNFRWKKVCGSWGLSAKAFSAKLSKTCCPPKFFPREFFCKFSSRI